jgi:hypothetical protein
MEKKFYDNGFRPEHAKQILTKLVVCSLKMEFMTVVEISFQFVFSSFYDDLAFTETVYASFLTLSTTIRNYTGTPKNVKTRKKICLLFLQ